METALLSTMSIATDPGDYSPGLEAMADRLLHLNPSEVSSRDLQEIEYLLNTVYIQAYKDNWPADIHDALLEGLNWTGKLYGDTLKSPPSDLYSDGFFKKVKQLARLLNLLAYYLSQENPH